MAIDPGTIETTDGRCRRCGARAFILWGVRREGDGRLFERRLVEIRCSDRRCRRRGQPTAPIPDSPVAV
jgi:hypothetical protein